MKDLEKIKSEDLGCQVQDANPGNFAIEQEVAQLVGATVPAPTEPSADDARELGAQLLVFLRRALLPIRSALRTALAAIYAHLDSRCTAYTPAAYASYIPRPYDPMGTPPTPRSVANLLTAITAFSPRKISNGSATNDGIKDGVSLAHLLCGSDAANAVTKIVDDNYGWVMDKEGVLRFICEKYPNLEELVLNCNAITAYIADSPRTGISKALKLILTDCSSVVNGLMIGWYSPGYPNMEVHIHGLKTTDQSYNGASCLYVGKYYLYDYERGEWRVGGSGSYGNTTTTYIYIGCKGAKTDLIRLWNNYSNTSVQDIEIREGACQSLTLTNFDGLTETNIYNHILCKLKNDEADCGDGVTITLGTANLDKLTSAASVAKLAQLRTLGYTFA